MMVPTRKIVPFTPFTRHQAKEKLPHAFSQAKKHVQACPDSVQVLFSLTQLAEIQQIIFPFFALKFNLESI
jgi:hypothetical protein